MHFAPYAPGARWADGSGQVTLHMGQHGAIENIAFADEWDDEAPVVQEDTIMDVDVKPEVEGPERLPSQQAQAAPSPSLEQQKTSSQPALLQQQQQPLQPQPQPQPQMRVKVLSRLPSAAEPAAIAAFRVELVFSSSTASASASASAFSSTVAVLRNDAVRQHALSVPGAVERVDILPLLLRQPTTAGALKIQMRPAHSVAEVPVEDEERRSSAADAASPPKQEAKQDGREGERYEAAQVKWMTRPAVGLNVYEILNTDEGKSGLYRLFVNKGHA